jgi:hypothetical protein
MATATLTGRKATLVQALRTFHARNPQAIGIEPLALRQLEQEITGSATLPGFVNSLLKQLESMGIALPVDSRNGKPGWVWQLAVRETPGTQPVDHSDIPSRNEGPQVPVGHGPYKREGKTPE